MYVARIRHATTTVMAATTSPTTASCRVLSVCCPSKPTTPASAVPACVGAPFKNARTWSRSPAGVTLINDSQAGDAADCSHVPSTNRTATRVPNPAAMAVIPKAPT